MKLSKYTTIFSSQIKPIVSEEKDKYLALASLNELKKFIPEIDTETNIDLLPVAFNACVINRVNKNGDVIDTETGIAIAKTFVNKPINIEHNRKVIVGTILTYGFTEFGTDKPLTVEEARALKGPFNIVLGGVIWRVASGNLTDLIEESNDPTSENYQKISASWELGFTDFHIVVIDGSSKNIEDGAIITDPEEKEKLKNHLKSYGGTGKVDKNKHLYRLASEGVFAMGIGLTETPAAEVQGVAVSDKNKEESEASYTEEESKKLHEMLVEYTKKSINEARSMLNNDINIKINEEKISQPSNQDVNRNSKIMTKIATIQDITDEALKDMKASSITEFIQEEVKKISDLYVAEKTSKETAVKAADEKHAALLSDNDKLKQDLEKVQATILKLEEEKAAKDRQEKFTARMATLDEEYELAKEDREIIANQIRDMDDASFEKHHKDLAVLLKEKSKAAIKSRQEAEAKRTETAVASEAPRVEEPATVVEKAVEGATTEQPALPKSTVATEPTLREKYQKAFSIENFVITNR